MEFTIFLSLFAAVCWFSGIAFREGAPLRKKYSEHLTNEVSSLLCTYFSENPCRNTLLSPRRR